MHPQEISFSPGLNCLPLVSPFLDSHIPIDVDDTSASDSSALTSNSRRPPPLSQGRGQGRGRGGGHLGRQEDRFCKFCNSLGHVEDKCWSKHGKPDWAKPASSNSSTYASSLVAAAPSDSSSPLVGNTVTLSHEDFENLLMVAPPSHPLPRLVCLLTSLLLIG